MSIFNFLICWLPFTGGLSVCDECDAPATAKARVMEVLRDHRTCPADVEAKLDAELEAGSYCDRKAHHDSAEPGVWTTASIACLSAGSKVGLLCEPRVDRKTWRDRCEGI